MVGEKNRYVLHSYTLLAHTWFYRYIQNCIHHVWIRITDKTSV